MTTLRLALPNTAFDAEYIAQNILNKVSEQSFSCFHLVICKNQAQLFQIKNALHFQYEQLGITDEMLEQLILNDRETLPYDRFSPPPELISDRLYCLNQLRDISSNKNQINTICLTTIQTLMTPLPPVSHLDAHTFILKTGELFNTPQKINHLTQAGYHKVREVKLPGELSQRGSIIDIFPMAAKKPIRIDLFDDEIDSIRLFNPKTQHSFEKIESVNILPAHEFDLSDESITIFKNNFKTFFPDKLTSPIYKAISNQHAIGGLEYYLPCFFPKNTTLLDYIPTDNNKYPINIYRLPDIQTEAEKFWTQILERYNLQKQDPDYPPLLPERLFSNPNNIFNLLNKHPANQQTLFYRPENAPKKVQTISNQLQSDFNQLAQLLVDQKFIENSPHQKLKNLQKTFNQYSFIITCSSIGRSDIFLEQLNKAHITAKILPSQSSKINLDQNIFWISSAQTTEPLIQFESKKIILPEDSLYNLQSNYSLNSSRQKSIQKDFDTEQTFHHFKELTPGDLVVHIEHGIARYLGLTNLDINNSSNTEFVTLEYAHNEKLYLPVSEIHKLSRYKLLQIDQEEENNNAILHRLGNDKWSKTRAKAIKHIYDTSAELLSLYAERASKIGTSHRINSDLYQSFLDYFPFQETPDQFKASQAIENDLINPHPMDRLLCGDVGFGKTEIAMRAAFIVASSNYQVALLCPTTLLAQQHTESFKTRFSNFALNIESLSRFKSQKNQTEINNQLKNGQIDIIIGTHALLSEQIQFKNLGLVIIDEEHRFGVKHKEKLKKLRNTVDILSMTATPIPRTLNMAFSTLRDLSIISTPPAKRLAVQTFIKPFDLNIIQEAIAREIFRGGQIYFLHNSVQSIYNLYEELRQKMPSVKFEIAHGQMSGKQLEQTMQQFSHNHFQVLLCTTIIETGIDIPNANTIIIDRADKLGLAQLHQLRGRVGRSHHQAYAYLLTPDNLTKDAKKRLHAIESASTLGAGFEIAQHDMEIRGTGAILGDAQSGHMHNIGNELYTQILNQAIGSLKSGQKLDINKQINTLNNNILKIELGLSERFPENYIPDIQTRIKIYQKIANIKNQSQLDQIKIDCIDQYGLLPKEAQEYFKNSEIRLRAQNLKLTQIQSNKRELKIIFDPDNPYINMPELIKLIQKQPNQYKLIQPAGIRILNTQFENSDSRVKALENIINNLFNI